MEPIGRRTFLAASSLLPLAALVPRSVLAQAYTGATGFTTLSAHQAAVVEAATARLIPGPRDDPAEVGHPGAREANVVRYIDTMLGALDGSPARVFAGGPFSNRAGAKRDDMARFISLDEVERTAWKLRLADLRRQYTAGVAALDDGARAAGSSDFTAATPALQDAILATDPGQFMSLLMQHAIEGMYSNPEYGGNASLVGWKDIAFPGDNQPRGFTATEVTTSDGPDPLALTPPILAALALISSTSPPET